MRLGSHSGVVESPVCWDVALCRQLNSSQWFVASLYLHLRGAVVHDECLLADVWEFNACVDDGVVPAPLFVHADILLDCLEGEGTMSLQNIGGNSPVGTA